MKQEPERSPMRPEHGPTAAVAGSPHRACRRGTNGGLPEPDAAAAPQDAGAAGAGLRGPARAGPAHAGGRRGR